MNLELKSLYKNKTLALSIIILIGALLRIYKIDSTLLYVDEYNSLLRSSQSLAGMFDLIGKNNQSHPPLYYILLHFWLMLGQNVFMLRLFSAFFGILSIPLIFLVAERLAGRLTAFIAAFLFAISPFLIYYSQFGKGYSLEVFFAASSLYYLIELVLKDNPRKINLFGYFLSCMLGLFTHYMFFFFILAQDLYLLFLWRRQRKLVVKILFIQFIILIILAVWIIAFAYFYGGEYLIVLNIPFISKASSLITASPTPVHAQLFIPSLMSLPATFFTMVAGHIFLQSEGHMFPIVLSSLLILIILSAAFLLNRGENKKKVLLLFVIIIPVIASFLFLYRTTLYTPRYAIVSSVGFLILLSIGLTCLITRLKKFSVLIIATFLFLNIYFLNYYYNSSSFYCRFRPDWKVLTGFISSNFDKDDLLVLYGRQPKEVELFFVKQSYAYITLPRLNKNNVEAVLASVKAAAANRNKVGFLSLHEFVFDKDGVIQGFLAKEYKIGSLKSFCEDRFMEDYRLISFVK